MFGSRPTATSRSFDGAMKVSPLNGATIATKRVPSLDGFPPILPVGCGGHVDGLGASCFRTVESPPPEDRKVNTPWLDAATVLMVTPSTAMEYRVFGTRSART